MSNLDPKQFVEDRHKALADVLYNDSIAEMQKYCEKYGMAIPKGAKADWVMKAGALKAIQECTDFTEDEKKLAMRKAVEMGTNPFMWPYGREED